MASGSLLSTDALPAVQEKHVRVFVWQIDEMRLALDLPVDLVHSVVNKPLKYLAYAAWSICGKEGSIQDYQGGAVDMDRLTLNEKEQFMYTCSEPISIRDIVDVRFMKHRGNSSASRSSAPGTRTPNFSSAVKARDGGCVFTGEFIHTHAAHIAPFRLGEDFQDDLLTHDVRGLGVNDVRNGITLSSHVHQSFFDKHEFAILPVPNPFLRQEDMIGPDPDHPEAETREELQDILEQKYPQDRQYYFHWISTPKVLSPDTDRRARRLREVYIRKRKNAVAHCTRASFANTSPASLPHAGILHYRYASTLLLNFAVGSGLKGLQKKLLEDADEDLNKSAETNNSDDDNDGSQGNQEEQDRDDVRIVDSNARHTGPHHISDRERDVYFVQDFFDSYNRVSQSFEKVDKWRHGLQASQALPRNHD